MTRRIVATYRQEAPPYMVASGAFDHVLMPAIYSSLRQQGIEFHELPHEWSPSTQQELREAMLPFVKIDSKWDAAARVLVLTFTQELP